MVQKTLWKVQYDTGSLRFVLFGGLLQATVMCSPKSTLTLEPFQFSKKYNEGMYGRQGP